MTKIQVDSNGKAIMLNNKALEASEGGTATLITKNITQNGTYNASSDNADGYSSVTVDVSTSEPEITTLTITPTTTSQTITAPSGTDGYNPVNVSAVTASIDSNIQAGNIKKDVTILGVTGTLETGITPTGTLSITENGTYNVTNYANADVNVSGGSFIGLQREVSANGVYQVPTISFTFSLPSNATNIGTNAMYDAFYGCTGLTSVDLSSLTTISGANAMYNAFYGCTGLTGALDLSSLTIISGGNAMYQAFYNCTGLTSVDLSSLTTISGSSAMTYTFYNCIGLTGALDLSSLTTISGTSVMYYAFYHCTSLTSVDLSSLTTISGSNAMQSAFYYCIRLTSILFTNLETIGLNTSSGDYAQFAYCFSNCNNLTSIAFPKLEKIYCTGGTSTSLGTFANNTKVEKLYFPKLDTITYGSGASTSNQEACKNIFYGCTALTELHFGADNQSAIEASPGYSTAWGRGAGNVTIYFDL